MHSESEAEASTLMRSFQDSSTDELGVLELVSETLQPVDHRVALRYQVQPRCIPAGACMVDLQNPLGAHLFAAATMPMFLNGV